MFAQQTFARAEVIFKICGDGGEHCDFSARGRFNLHPQQCLRHFEPWREPLSITPLQSASTPGARALGWGCLIPYACLQGN
eukprot:131127-Prorocentrum_minimum.AAC.4